MGGDRWSERTGGRGRGLSDRRVITLAVTAVEDEKRRERFRRIVGTDRLRAAVDGAERTGRTVLARRGRRALAALSADQFHRGHGTDKCGQGQGVDSDE